LFVWRPSEIRDGRGVTLRFTEERQTLVSKELASRVFPSLGALEKEIITTY
jgi:hypothetical protein